METITNNILKNRTISSLIRINNKSNNIKIDLELSIGDFNKINHDSHSNILLIYMGSDNSMDFAYDYDCLPKEDKIQIINNLKNFL